MKLGIRWAVVVVALVSACGGDATVAPTSTPLVAVVPTASAPSPTARPKPPTPTDEPTPLPIKTPTPTPSPTPTPTPKATPTPSATPTATTTPDATPAPTATATPTAAPTGTPDVTGNMTLLGKWTTHFIPSSLNGFGANIRVPAQRIDGTIVKAGKQFDFLGAIGPVTNPPYAMGGYLRNGQIQADPGILGGGMCSASTTLFNAALRSGLQIIERHAHAIYISRYPVGLDATVFEFGPGDGKNATFVNDTGHPIRIRAYSGAHKVTFEIWGVDDHRTIDIAKPVIANVREATDLLEYTDDLAPGERHRIQDRYDGFHSAVSRTVRDANGKVIWNDTFQSSYRLLSGIVQVGRYPGDPPAGTRIPIEDYPGPPDKH